MPTYNRRAHVAQAIACFQRQTYAHKELIILDDGEDAIADLVPPDPAIRYIRAGRYPSLGAKRNTACAAARGPFLLHWDDDDWYAPHRIAAQIAALETSGADVGGIDRAWFLDPATPAAWQYVYPAGGPGWVCGATLCFRDHYWRAHPFPELSIGEDTLFAAAVPPGKLHILPDPDIFVGLIHPANTSAKETAHSCWQPHPVERVAQVLGADSARYLRNCAHASARPRISVALPHGGEDRAPQLAACLAGLAGDPAIAEVIVVEMSDRPQAHAIVARWGARHVFAPLEGAYDRAQARNIGAALGSAEFTLWLDNDLILPPGFLHRALREIDARGLDFLIPYAQIDYLGEADSLGVRQGVADPALLRPTLSVRPGREVSGGAGLVRRSFIDRFGAVPEGFKGWGGEDNAFVYKVEVLGSGGWSEDPAQRIWHLYHANSGGYDRDVARNNPHHADNVRLLAQIGAERSAHGFLAKFPPALPSLPWSRDRRIVFAGAADNALLRRADAAFSRRLRCPVTLGTTDQADAVVRFAGDTVAIGDNTLDDLAGLDDDELALAIAAPLSFVLNYADWTAPVAVPHEPPVVWTYWEGDCPAWIATCLASIAAHAPRHRHLDRAGFDALRTTDRDIRIDGLHVAHRADYIRAYLVAHYGGLWIDADCLVMRSLAPLLDQLHDAGFVAHRDRQGYFPNELFGATAGHSLARAFYDRVCATLRAGAPLAWISLGGEPLTQLLQATAIPFAEIPMSQVQPICWSTPEAYFAMADDAVHAARAPADTLCHMLSHQEVNKLKALQPALALDAPGTYFSYLAARSCIVPSSPDRLPLAALAFFLEQLAAHSPRHVLEIGDGPPLLPAILGHCVPQGCTVVTATLATAAAAGDAQGFDAIIVTGAFDDRAAGFLHAVLRASPAAQVGLWRRQSGPQPLPAAYGRQQRRSLGDAGEVLWFARQDSSAASSSAAHQAVFARVHAGNVALGGETVSGPGSTLDQTRFVRRALPLMLQDLGICTMIDAGCGDGHWLGATELGLECVTAIDCLPALIEAGAARLGNSRFRFEQGDVITDLLPRADLVLCRDVLTHYPDAAVFAALRNFAASGATYVLTTTYPAHATNTAIAIGDWRPLNLTAAPFALPPPLRVMVEGCTEAAGTLADKSLALWRLGDIERHLWSAV